MINLEAIYTNVDDFFLLFIPQWEAHLIESGLKQRIRPSKLSTSEVTTIVIAFHQSRYRNFETFYINHSIRYWIKHFPSFVSYTRMLKLLQSVLILLSSFLTQRNYKFVIICVSLDINFLMILLNEDVEVWDEFKLHLIINDEGSILAVKVTTGNVDDRAHKVKELYQLHDEFS